MKVEFIHKNLFIVDEEFPRKISISDLIFKCGTRSWIKFYLKESREMENLQRIFHTVEFNIV